MSKFFAKDWKGSRFIWFGKAHILTLLVILLVNVLLIWFGKHASDKTINIIAYAMAGILWVNELSFHLWKARIGEWTIQEMLPLHLCSLLVWTGGLMLVTKNYSIYEFCYFLGIAGAFQALLTPDLDKYGFPHFRFFQTYISHGLIITAAIYMTVVVGFRPTWMSLLRVALWGNIYMAIVFVINKLIGSNYLFVAHKPPTASLLDKLPAWPWYIAWMEVIGLVMCLLLYMPFAFKGG
jgi:hypothetical integral membrane protein (TIGR02206 family)